MMNRWYPPTTTMTTTISSQQETVQTPQCRLKNPQCHPGKRLKYQLNQKLPHLIETFEQFEAVIPQQEYEQAESKLDNPTHELL
jgi:hypothetical protein